MAQQASKTQPSKGKKGKDGGKKSSSSPVFYFVGPKGQRVEVTYNLAKNRWFDADGKSKIPRNRDLIIAVLNGEVVGKAGSGGRLVPSPKPQSAPPKEEPAPQAEPTPKGEDNSQQPPKAAAEKQPEVTENQNQRGKGNMSNFFWSAVGLALLGIVIWAAFGTYYNPTTEPEPVVQIQCGEGTALRGSSCVAVSPPPLPASVASRLARREVADPSPTSYQRPIGDPSSSMVRRAPDGLPAMSRSRWRACLQQLGLLKQCSPRIINGREVIWCSTDAALEQARQCN